MSQIKIHTGQRIILETIVEICLCLAGGLALTLLVIDQTVFNADAVSPFFQAKLITTGVTADPSQLSFARIPSIFPDLATLISLTAISPNAGLEFIFPRYAFIIASLFIFIQAEFTRLSLTRTSSKARTTVITLAITLCLTSTIPEFRTTFGLMLTPLHHGGNIICTYLLGCVLVWNPFSNNPRIQHFRLGAAATSIVIGISSNKLFVFTGMAPAAMALCLTSWTTAKTYSISAALRKLKTKKESILALSIACGIGFAIPSLLNGQCSLPIVIKPGVIYPQLIKFIQSNHIFLAAFITGIITVMMLSAKAFQSNQKNIAVTSALLLGMTFIVSSSISPLAYAWLLGEPGSLHIRYVMIMGPTLCTVIAITGAKSVLHFDQVYSQKLEKYLPFGTMALATILLIITAQNSKISSWNLENTFQQRLKKNHSNSSRIAFLINQKGLKNGLSDFWGVKLGVWANMPFNNEQPVSIEPIARDGSPDLWATSIKQFFNRGRELKSYDFVVTSDTSFEKGILEAYGVPSENLIIEGSKRKLLIYRSEEAQERIRKILSKKLSTYRRQCDRNSPNFQER